MIDYSVPFFANTEDNTHCFQAALRMVLAYFLPEQEFSWQELEQLTAKPEGKWTWPIATILWMREHGFDVRDIETFDYRRFADDGEQYLRDAFGEEVASAQAAHSDLEQERRLSRMLLESFPYEQREPSRDDLEALLGEGYLLLCTINAKKLRGEDGYASHSVVVKGCDGDMLQMHDPGPPGMRNQEVPFSVFERAWAYPDPSAKNILAIRLA